jgi:hypothetical protein
MNLSADHALGLESGIDHDVVGGDLDHGSDDDGARLELGGTQTLFKEFGKAFGHGMKLS